MKWDIVNKELASSDCGLTRVTSLVLRHSVRSFSTTRKRFSKKKVIKN